MSDISRRNSIDAEFETLFHCAAPDAGTYGSLFDEPIKKVNVNDGSITDLMGVKGIGQKTLIQILKLREQLGTITVGEFVRAVHQAHALIPYLSFEPSAKPHLHSKGVGRDSLGVSNASGMNGFGEGQRGANVYAPGYVHGDSNRFLRAYQPEGAYPGVHQEADPMRNFSQDPLVHRDQYLQQLKAASASRGNSGGPDWFAGGEHHRDNGFRHLEPLAQRGGSEPRPSRASGPMEDGPGLGKPTVKSEPQWRGLDTRDETGGRGQKKVTTPTTGYRNPEDRGYLHDQRRSEDPEETAPKVYRVASLPRNISFDGKETWGAFKCKFISFVDSQSWEDRVKRDNLCWCLTGPASDYFSSLVRRQPKITFEEVMDKLERRFDVQDLPETSQMLFQTASQSPKEALVEWADRVLGLALNAFPELEDNHVYQQAVMRFCQGLADKEAGHYALMARPRSIDDALDKVRWYQHADQVIYSRGKGVRQLSVAPSEDVELLADAMVCRTGVRYPAQETRTGASTLPGRRVQFADNSAEDLRISAVEKRVGHLQDQMKSVLEGIENLTTLINKSNRSRSRSPGIRSRSPSTCFGCGEEGHFKRECPKSQRDSIRVSMVEESENYSGSEM